ncbi:tetratricopeptide repeat protein [Rivularia sp. UHCC 0363]|uniref:tetratricopeptide repeat protein n=1 Tax=Rivularia sp. UHCC 0363 TaxID=3110244 RepID=UPI002B1FFA6A|nr:tetratricopeptide repeat protein [Rivularia sp. UHCC 0363]MEA5598476.1 tetratricopeptide repeat protein [Rivularia sp. UHCC 0363]
MMIPAVKRIIPILVSSVFLIIYQPAFAASAGEYRLFGLQLRQQGRYNEAITAMEKSVELEPENISGRVNLGWTLHLAGKEGEAATSLWKAIYQKPDFVPAYNALGIVYLVDGNLPAAVIVHSWAGFLKPDNEIAFYNLSLALHQLKIYPLAITTANRAAILEPNNPHPLVAAAISYWDNKDKSLAQQVYRQAINLDARYIQPTFLSHLKKAAFTQEQINTVKELLVGSSGQTPRRRKSHLVADQERE